MVSDMGEKVVPFSREFHVNLGQEMIHARGIEAAVLPHPGSGQALLAFVWERKRAVGVLKHAKARVCDETLAQAVQTLGLAPDRRPAKPAELVAWETARSVGGSPPAAGGGSTAAAVANAPQPQLEGRPSLTALPATLAVAAAVAHPGTRPHSAGVPPTVGVPPSVAAFGSSALRCN